MTFYVLLWLLLFYLSFSGIFKGKKSSYIWALRIILVIAFFVGFRYKVGSDWIGYVNYYYSGVAIDRDSGQMEPIFTIIRVLCYKFGLPHTIFFYIISAFSMGVMIYAGRKFGVRNYYIFLLVFVSLFLCSLQFNLVRNGAMASCAWVALSYKANNNLKYSLLWVIIACGFHLTGLIFIPFIFLVDKRLSNVSLLVLFVVAVVCFVLDLGGWILSQFPILAYIDRLNVYMKNDDLESYGLSIGMIFNIALLFYLFLKYRYSYNNDVYFRVCFNAFVFSLFISLTFNNLGIVVSRLGQSLNMATMFLWPFVFSNTNKKNIRNIIGIFFIAYLLMYYYKTWGSLNDMGENPNYPYQFELFQDRNVINQTKYF
ncbi:EpsG family protein [Prevotella communis]|uniref:EpsG family protein n=1 Tax=Prevotella communis TaxID=2913614 RepID=UPI001EDAB3D8|nr:EpsG family protein [Prevotella communis]UKK56821.1 EpsG family protein [Prevotella communis]